MLALSHKSRPAIFGHISCGETVLSVMFDGLKIVSVSPVLRCGQTRARRTRASSTRALSATDSARRASTQSIYGGQGAELAWGHTQYSAADVASSWGTTFGGGGTHNGKSQAYGGGANQAAFDMAYMLDGKYQLKKDPTLRGHVRSPYL